MNLPLTMVLLTSVSWLLAGPSAYADEALAKSKGCLGCHGIETAIVGPAYKEVARKYAGQGVADQLAQKVMKGGGGVWGSMPMPPNSVTPEEAKTLVTWVLGLK